MSELWKAEASSPDAFAYENLETETRLVVLQATQQIQKHMRQTAESVIQVGQQLLAVKQVLPYGQFMAWVQSELGMSRQTCQNFMNVAQRFADRLPTVGNLSLKVLYELAVAPDPIVEQVQQQQVPATLSAIREAKAALRVAQEAEGRAKEEAEQERRTASLWQQELEQARRQAEAQQEALQRQIEALQEDQKRHVQPEVITREVVPEAVQGQLETLRRQVETLKQQREALSKQAEALAEQARETALHAEEAERAQAKRSRWRTSTEEALHVLSRVLIGWPSPLDAYQFEEDDWRRLTQVEEYLSRLQNACLRLHRTVEQTVVVPEEVTRMQTP